MKHLTAMVFCALGVILGLHDHAVESAIYIVGAALLYFLKGEE
jgi:hypothetical protein